MRFYEREVTMVRSILLVMAYGMIPLATSSTALPTQYLPIWGGGGGQRIYP